MTDSIEDFDEEMPFHAGPLSMANNYSKRINTLEKTQEILRVRVAELESRYSTLYDFAESCQSYVPAYFVDKHSLSSEELIKLSPLRSCIVNEDGEHNKPTEADILWGEVEAGVIEAERELGLENERLLLIVSDLQKQVMSLSWEKYPDKK